MSTRSTWLFLLLGIFAAAQAVEEAKITHGPVVEDVKSRSAVIAWSTDKTAPTQLRYGTTPMSLPQTAEGEAGSNHRIFLKGLLPNTNYYFRAESGTALSPIRNFRTRTETGPAQLVAGPIAQRVTDTEATLWWLVSTGGPMTLKYGLNYSQPELAARSEGAAEQRLTLSKLQPAKTYYFQLLDDGGRLLYRGEFDTLPANYKEDKRVRIINGPVIEHIAAEMATIAWSTNVQSSTVLRYSTDPNNLSKVARAPWGQETHRVHLSGLKPNTTYYFVVESGQAAGTGTLAKSTPAVFRTTAAGAPPFKTGY